MTENEAPKKIVIAYIDASNIILSARRAGLDLDLLRLRQYILDKYRTNEIYYFTPNLKSTKDENEALIKAGFKIVFKEIYYENSNTKANCDVEISHYITKHIENNQVSKLILLSGDGDFSMLLDYANTNEIKVEVLSTDVKSTSYILKKKKYMILKYLVELGDKIEKSPANT